MNQSIEDESRKEFTQTMHRLFLLREDEIESPDGFSDLTNADLFKLWQAARQSSQSEPVATADYIAYLYSDGNKLKIAEEMPPPDNAFPVFTTNIRFLDVARLVLDDNVDLILEHGGVKLWEALVTKVNKDYAEKNHE
jgi:hypothetical protein